MTYDAEISISPVAADASVSPIGFREALAGIRDGRWAAKVEAVRKAHQAGGKDASDAPKKQLPGVTFSGKFSYRSSAKIIKHSGLICADMDKLGDQVGAYKERFAADPHVIAVFVSPTETGLKAIFRCDPERPHKESFESLEHYVIKHFGIPPDEKCKDASRLCFVSHDPELFEADEAEVIPYLPPRPKPETEARKDAPADAEIQPGEDFNRRGGPEVPKLLKKHGWTHHQGKYWCRPGKEGAVSASWDVIPNVFHPFSNAPETKLPSDIEGFDPYGLFTWLEHSGDYTASTRALGKMGYGTQPKKKEKEGVQETEAAKEPVLIARPLGDFRLPDKDDPNVLIGKRWLSRGDIFILASTSGMGKSSLSIQAAVTWGLGLPLFGGFHPHRPLKSLIIQSEDGDGDIAEVRLSLEHAMKLTPEQCEQVNQNVIIVTDRVHRGLSFRAELKRLVDLHSPDIVWINPLLAFIGGDVNDSTDVGTFLREQLNSLNEPARFAYGVVHHTAKPPKDRKERQWNEVMYEMAGSADLTNASRAVLALQATETQGEFRLIAAKRGPRAGLTERVPGTQNPEIMFDQPTSVINLRHSKDKMTVNGQELPVIHWERFEKTKGSSEDKPIKTGRKPSYFIADFYRWIPKGVENALPANQIFRKTNGATGITDNGFKKLLFRASEEGSVFLTDIPGKGPCYHL